MAATEAAWEWAAAWAAGPGLDEERLESAKACLITGVVGTFVAAPLLAGMASSGGSVPLQLSLMAMSSALFGATYRCIVRQDDNLQLKLGAIAAFALVRGFATVPLTMPWNSDTSADLFMGVWVGAAAFSHAAYVYEQALDEGYAFLLDGSSQALGMMRPDFGRNRGGMGGGMGGGFGGHERRHEPRRHGRPARRWLRQPAGRLRRPELHPRRRRQQHGRQQLRQPELVRQQPWRRHGRRHGRGQSSSGNNRGGMGGPAREAAYGNGRDVWRWWRLENGRRRLDV